MKVNMTLAAGVAALASLLLAAAGGSRPAPTTTAAAIGPDFAAINEQAGPAVVQLRVAGMRGVSDQQDDDDNDRDATHALVGSLRRGFGRALARDEAPVRGEGSGFIIASDGIVLTNAHVVDHATEVVVRLADHRELSARVLGIDTKTDVAVLKIAATGLPVVKLGDPARLRAGEWVLAIGSPFGLDHSVTAGIVSATGRPLPDNGAVRFIQTDVPINPGNSGGPLINSRGEVVGINSQIYSKSGGYMGLSFAIPIDVATRVERQIVATGRAAHARLGLTGQDLDSKLAGAFRLGTTKGALVSDVQKGSPAERAGLEPGDVVLHIDGRAIDDSSDLSVAVAMHAPGDEVRLDVWHHGAAHDVRVALADGGDPVAAQQHADKTPAPTDAFGLALRPLVPDGAREGGARGLLIAEVQAQAALAGLQPGDLLLNVDGKPVDTPAAARAALVAAGASAALLVQRGSQRIFVPVARG